MTSDSNTSEAATFWRYISSSLERLVALALDLDSAGFGWKPPAPDTNSIAVLAFHTLGNAEENLLETLCGQTVNRDRDSEFATDGHDQESLRKRWETLRPRLDQALNTLDDPKLDERCKHPRRGVLSGREVLIVVARHSAEHLGQAELTRDLWQSRRTSQTHNEREVSDGNGG